MGKKLRQQRRGKGSNTYRKLPNTFDVNVKFAHDASVKRIGEVVALFNSTGHTVPIMEIQYEDLSKSMMIAPEGIAIGDKIFVDYNNNFTLGSVLKLSEIPEGIPIYNIESTPGDGGKMVRVAGAAAYIKAHIGGTATVTMPSKASVVLPGMCRAQLGVIAAGGILDQPLVKAGRSHYIYHALNRTWPRNRGVKMNPVDHPFGGKQHHKGKSSMTSRNAPPGRKVGHIAARRVGRKKKG
ncbi:50S ribosomal protein L2P [mine drainage metagenome]|uniref:50S ribosomal protein L2P n=1 Tax=mine drainage metagenome TaxID=410659 RepID=T0ZRD4_9ZZZZ